MDYPMVNSFWSTVEVHCACSGFEYDQYIEHCKKYSKGAPLSRVGYKLLGELFYAEMEQSMHMAEKFTLEPLA